jgi:hypothetical protein
MLERLHEGEKFVFNYEGIWSAFCEMWVISLKEGM